MNAKNGMADAAKEEVQKRSKRALCIQESPIDLTDFDLCSSPEEFFGTKEAENTEKSLEDQEAPEAQTNTECREDDELLDLDEEEV
jgi:hypothetical protein